MCANSPPPPRTGRSTVMSTEIGPHTAAARASGTALQTTQTGIKPAIPYTRYLVPPDYDPRVVAHIDGYEDHAAYAAPAFAAFEAASSGIKRLSDARHTAHELGQKGKWNEAQQILMVSKEASTLQTSILRKFDSARTSLSESIRALNDSLSTPLMSKANTPVSTAVWAHVAALPLDKRHEFITDRLDKNDQRSLDAILGAPAYLSGLTDEMQASYTRMYHEKNQPQIAGRLKVMKKSLELVEARGVRIALEIEKAMGARWSTVQELNKAQDDIQKMLALVNAPPVQS